MQENKNTGPRDPLPENFDTIDDFWNFWDTHSSADYEDEMETVDVEVDIDSRKMYCAISNDLLTRVRAYARRQGCSTETLINLWVQEKLSAAAESV